MRVFVARRLPELDGGADARTYLQARLEGVEVEVFAADRPPTPEELRAGVAGCEGLLSLLTDRVDAALLDAAPDLRIVANLAVGYDNIDVDACRERGVVVTNTPDVLTDATADLTFGLVLATARRFSACQPRARTGDIGAWSPTEWLGMELAGRTLGIFGFGRIGRAVARRARGFGLEVVYCTRSEVPADAREGASPVDFDALLARSDVLCLCAPLTPETRGRFDADAFARVKPGALLVNTARGPLVREEALVEALASGRLGGAGLDVFEEEPVVHPGLLDRDDVVLTPHVGSATTRTRQRMATIALDNLVAVLSGGDAKTPV